MQYLDEQSPELAGDRAQGHVSLAQLLTSSHLRKGELFRKQNVAQEAGGSKEAGGRAQA